LYAQCSPCAPEAAAAVKVLGGGALQQMLQAWELELSDEACDLLQRMLTVNPEERITIEEILQHPWCNPP